MVKYEVIEKFKDEDGKIYQKDSRYPMPAHKKITKKRINELTTKDNKVGRPFIREVKENKK